MKIHFNTHRFSLHWKLAKMPNFMPLISSSKSNEHSTQTNWLSLTFFNRRELLLGINWLSVKPKRGRTDKCQESKDMKEISRLPFSNWVIIMSPICEFVPQIRSSNIILVSDSKSLQGLWTLTLFGWLQCNTKGNQDPPD